MRCMILFNRAQILIIRSYTEGILIAECNYFDGISYESSSITDGQIWQHFVLLVEVLVDSYQNQGLATATGSEFGRGMEDYYPQSMDYTLDEI